MNKQHRFDPKITEAMKLFIEAPDEQRDYDKACEILLRVSGNRVQYRNFISKGPRHFAPYILKRIQDYYEFRLRKITHRQVAEMSAKADEIVAKAEDTRRSAGIRPDHDSLPQEVKAAYVQVLDCINKQRELHMQIRRLALHQASCPDSEIYPFVKEIIRLDELRLSLWKKYDSFKTE